MLVSGAELSLSPNDFILLLLEYAKCKLQRNASDTCRHTMALLWAQRTRRERVSKLLPPNSVSAYALLGSLSPSYWIPLVVDLSVNLWAMESDGRWPRIDEQPESRTRAHSRRLDNALSPTERLAEVKFEARVTEAVGMVASLEWQLNYTYVSQDCALCVLTIEWHHSISGRWHPSGRPICSKRDCNEAALITIRETDTSDTKRSNANQIRTFRFWENKTILGSLSICRHVVCPTVRMRFALELWLIMELMSSGNDREWVAIWLMDVWLIAGANHSMPALFPFVHWIAGDSSRDIQSPHQTLTTDWLLVFKSQTVLIEGFNRLQLTCNIGCNLVEEQWCWNL